MFGVMRGLKLPFQHPNFNLELCKKAIHERVEFSQGQKMPMVIGIGRAGIFNDITMEQVEKALEEWPKFAAAAQ